MLILRQGEFSEVTDSERLEFLEQDVDELKQNVKELVNQNGHLLRIIEELTYTIEILSK